jgi:hypothetical protein
MTNVQLQENAAILNHQQLFDEAAQLKTHKDTGRNSVAWNRLKHPS